MLNEREVGGRGEVGRKENIGKLRKGVRKVRAAVQQAASQPGLIGSQCIHYLCLVTADLRGGGLLGPILQYQSIIRNGHCRERSEVLHRGFLDIAMLGAIGSRDEV